MEHYLGVAKDQGITDDELGAVQSIVMAVSGGRVDAQFREARTGVKKPMRSFVKLVLESKNKTSKIH